MKTLTAFYFSGTGNTLYIAKRLCEKLTPYYSTSLVDITTAGAKEKLAATDVILVAFPIYGSSPPLPMRRFVHSCGELFRGKKVLIAETQYFFSGDGAASLGRTIIKYGGTIVGAEHFNMPNNLSDCRIFGIKNGEDTQKTLGKAEKRMDAFVENFLKGKVKKRGFSIIPHSVGYFLQRKYWRKGEQIKFSRLTVSEERCVGCGLCVKMCPMSNLRIVGKKAAPVGKCALCYRCVNMCPKKAITLIGNAPPEVQYKGPGRF